MLCAQSNKWVPPVIEGFAEGASRGFNVRQGEEKMQLCPSLLKAPCLFIFVGLELALQQRTRGPRWRALVIARLDGRQRHV